LRPRLKADGEDEEDEAQRLNGGRHFVAQVSEHQACEQHARHGPEVEAADPGLADPVADPYYEEEQADRVLDEKVVKLRHGRTIARISEDYHCGR
jgi:hypothetical protein